MGQSESSQCDSNTRRRRLQRRPSRPPEDYLHRHSGDGHPVDRPLSSITLSSLRVLRTHRPLSSHSGPTATRSAAHVAQHANELDDYPLANRAAREDHVTHISASPMPRRTRLSHLSDLLGRWHLFHPHRDHPQIDNFDALSQVVPQDPPELPPRSSRGAEMVPDAQLLSDPRESNAASPPTSTSSHLPDTETSQYLSSMAVANPQIREAPELSNFFQPIHRALQEIVQSENDPLTRISGDGRPMANLFRVFRVGSQSGAVPEAEATVEPTASGAGTLQDSSGATQAGDSILRDRNVTIVIVAIQSASVSEAPHNTAMPSGSSRPATRPITSHRSSSSSHALSHNVQDHTSSRLRLSRGRRWPGLRPSSDNISQTWNRGQVRSLALADRDNEVDSMEPQMGAYSSQFSDASSGPSPPASILTTDDGSAAVSTQQRTRNRPETVGSSSDDLPMGAFDQPDENTSPGTLTGRVVRAARTSRTADSVSVNHHHFGAGAARRNGVVAPDTLDTVEGNDRASRSWLVYVIGTNLSSPRSPLTAPSLFSDSPSYEDLLFLTSLLGPAKPPVASAQDIADAGGIHTVFAAGGGFIARCKEGAGTFKVAQTERCLICLEAYNDAEEVRKLTRCSHVFHCDCIDEWLMTGRNSCPLCREMGVEKQAPVTDDLASSDREQDMPEHTSNGGAA